MCVCSRAMSPILNLATVGSLTALLTTSKPLYLELKFNGSACHFNLFMQLSKGKNRFAKNLSLEGKPIIGESAQ